MLGARNGVVREVEPYTIHGSPHVRLVVLLEGGEAIQAQLGAESVPADLAVGDAVAVRFAMNVVIAIERPATPASP